MGPKMGSTLLFLGFAGLFLLSFVQAQFYTPSPIDKDPHSKYVVYCDFAEKNCSWSATGLWKWEKGTTGIQLDGPPGRSSYYMYTPLVANFTSSSKTSKEFLASPLIEAPSKNVSCFSFNYYTYLSLSSNDGITLFLLSSDETNKTEIWSRSGNDIDQWLDAKVDIVTDSNYKLIFEAYGERGIVAVENFRLYDGYCDHKKCDFESGMCRDWTTEGDPEGFTFKVEKAAKSSFKYPIDHTSHSPYGHFAYLDLPPEQVAKTTSRLLSPVLSNLDNQCFSFSFMRSNKGTPLRLLLKFIGNETYQTLWSDNYTHFENEWVNVHQTIDIRESVQLIFETGRSDVNNPIGVLAIDDIEFLPDRCPEAVTCNFLRGTCNWQPNRQRSLMWSIGTGRVARADRLKTKSAIGTYSTLLYADFTTLEPNSPPMAMELLSEFVSPNGEWPGACLEFDTKVQSIGPNDEFSIQQIAAVFEKRIEVWNWNNLKVKPSDDWHRHITVFVPNISPYAKYRLTLFANSSNPSTRIAVDSLRFTYDSYLCRNAPGAPTQPVTTSTTPQPSTKNPLSTLFCDFESGNFCNWKSSTPPNEFKLGSAQTIQDVPRRFLPESDHTLQSAYGHFAYSFNQKATGLLENATFNATWPAGTSYSICVDFAYYFYVSGSGSGAVLTADNSTGSTIIWRAPLGISNQWHRVQFSFSSYGKKFDSLTFRTTLVSGVFALDDIDFANGYCQKQVKNKDSVCDFEDGKTCLFEPVYRSRSLKWTVYNGSHESVRDHTTRSFDGHFYGIDLSESSPDHPLGFAPMEMLSTRIHAGSDREKCMRFSYYLDNVYQNTTTFGYVIEKATSSFDPDDDDPKELKRWEITGNTNSLWFIHRIPITWREDYKIRFFVKVKTPSDSSTKRGKVFIDDFMLSFEPCESRGCDFSKGNTCSMDGIPIGTHHLDKSVVPTIVDVENGTYLVNFYMNDFVEQNWQVFNPNQDSTPALYPKMNSHHSRANFLLMTADADWQRAIIVTERYAFKTNRFPRNSMGSTKHFCLSFSVNKPQNGNSFLQVYMGDSMSHSNRLLLNMKRGSSASYNYRGDTAWEQIEVLVVPDDQDAIDTFLYIVGTLGNGSSYIAIDDIKIERDCSNPSNDYGGTTLAPATDSGGHTLPVPTPSGYFFKCSNGTILPMSRVCNYVKDCADGEDEKECGKCYFHMKKDFCGYQDVPFTHGFGWKYTNDLYFFLAAINPKTVNFDDSDQNDLVAVIESPSIHQSYIDCVVAFQYKPNGTEISSNRFLVYLRDSVDGSKTTLFENNYVKMSDQIWNPIRINIGRVKTTFKVGFRGEIGSNDFISHGLNSVDVFNCGPRHAIDPEACSDDGTFRCGNGACINADKRCDFNDDCGDNSDEESCDRSKMLDFSEGLGLWTNPSQNSRTSGYDIRSSTSFSSMKSGPVYDHTNGLLGSKGKFLYYRQPSRTTTKGVQYGAELESPYFKITSRSCRVTFFYFKNSLDATISVSLQKFNDPDRRTYLKSFTDYTFGWTKAEPMFSAMSSPDTVYKLIISTTVTPTGYPNPYPYVAIDDISFSKSCQLVPDAVVPTLPTLPGGSTQTIAPDNCDTVRCRSPSGSMVCLDSKQFCDFVKDCADGSDEKNCGACDFDNGDLCSWTSSTFRRDWRSVKPASSAPGKAPKTDADNHSSGGYAAIRATLTSTSTIPATMLSPTINSRTHSECTFRFSYFSNRGGSLKVGKIRNQLSGYSFSFETSRSTSDWVSFSTNLGYMSRGWQVVVQGLSSTHYGFLSDIFVDNFVLINCDPNKPAVDPSGVTISPTATADVNTVSCDFEKDSCGWVNIEDGSVNNKRNFARLSNSYSEPGNDHTSLIVPRPTMSGTWLGTGSPIAHSDFYIRTDFPLPANQAYCFSFWYYLMEPNSYSTISLYTTVSTIVPSYLSYNSNYTELWKVNTPRERNWLPMSIEIPANASERWLMFMSQSYPHSAIGLDDFKLTKGVCPDQDIGESCNFEIGTCGWKVRNQSWNRTVHNIRDHTTDTYQGGLMELTANPGTVASMELALAPLPYFNETDSRKAMCLRAFYYIKEAAEEKPENQTFVQLRALRQGTEVWSKNITGAQVANENQLGVWGILQLNFYPTKLFTIQITGQRENSGSVVAIDDVLLQPHICEVNGLCDFENDFCGWTNVYSSYAGSFIRFQPNTRWQGGKFIHRDTTLRSSQGHYALYAIYDDQSQSAQMLRSPMIFTKANKICFRFNYFAMTTNNTAALKITFTDLTHPNKKDKKAIMVNSTKYLIWNEFQQTFTDVPHYFTLQISMVGSSVYTSDIGIDDIKVDNFGCDSDTPTPSPTISPAEKVLDCTFDSSCNWKLSDGWTTGSYNTLNDNYAPHRDHTFGTSAGKYAMLKLKDQVSKYTLESVKNVTEGIERCLTFWYYEDGESPFDITVFKSVNVVKMFLNRYSSQLESRKKWTLIKTDITVPSYSVDSNDTFGLVIQYEPGYVSNKDFSKFAIDDIQLVPGLCGHQTDYVYNFENDIEDLDEENILPLKSFALTIYNPGFSHNSLYPTVDHTTNTDRGHFFLFRPSNSYTKGSFFKNALAIVNLKPDFSGDKCVRFAYQITNNVTLKVFALGESDYNYDYDNDKGSLLWTAKFPTENDAWTVMELNKHKYYKHKILFYMTSISSPNDFLALDDIVVLNQKCQPAIDCDFQQSRYCSYSPMKVSGKDSFNFGIFTAPADDSNWPGPKYDHTTGSYGGSYLYLTSYRTSKTSSEHTAKIISGPRELVIGASYCLSMYTQLNTKDLSLKISMLRLDGLFNSHKPILLGTISNVQQKDWTLFNFQLNSSYLASSSQIQLILEGSLGAQSTGAIAIDDIVITNGTCPPSGNGALMCENGKLLNQSQICDFVKDCPSGLDEADCGTCNFENGLCGWKNTTVFTSLFSVVQANTAHNRISSAPAKDADFNSNGHYLLLSKSGRPFSGPTGEVAVNYDQPPMFFKLAYRTCVMVFDYYFKSISSKNSLEIKAGPNTADLSIVYKIHGINTKDSWRKGYAHLANRYSPFFVEMKGVTTDSGVVAVDNIRFENCSLPARQTSCSSDQFLCPKYSFCVSKDALCDYVNDCGDESDEKMCYNLPSRCNFEFSVRGCGIRDETSSNSLSGWHIIQPRGNSFVTYSGYEPEVDNTLHTPYGHYYLLTPGSTRNDALVGTFSSEMVNAKSTGPCKLRFFYYIADEVDKVTSTKIVLRIRYASKTTPESEIIKTFSIDSNGEVQQRWNKAVVELSYSSPFQVIFTGTLGTNKARIGIDDITYDQGCEKANIKPAGSTTLAPTQPPQPVTDGPQTTPDSGSSTNSPIHTNTSGHSPGHGGAIAAGILIPLFVVAAAVGVFFWFRRQQLRNAGDDTFSFSVNNVSEDDM